MISEGLEAIAIKLKQLADRVGRLERLDRPSGGTAYTLPTASALVKGGIKVGSRLSMSGETMSADLQGNMTGPGSAVDGHLAVFDTDAQHLKDGGAIPSGGGILPNGIINGGVDIVQQQVPGTLTAYANDTYCADMWNLLTNGGATDIQFQRVAGDVNSQYAGLIKQVNASAKYMGVEQIFPAANSIPYRGKTVNFQVRLKASTNTNIKFAIVEWTGTADTVTSNIIKTWTSTDYTVNNFFLASNLTIVGVSPSLAATTSFQTFNLSGTVSNNCNNLIVFWWTENAVAQNVTVTWTEAGLYNSSSEQAWNPIPFAEGLAIAMRYYEKSYSYDVAPASAVSAGANYVAALNTLYLEGPRFVVPKFKVPTVAIYSYAGTLNKVTVSATDTDFANSVTVPVITTTGVLILSTTGLTAGSAYYYQYIAESRL